MRYAFYVEKWSAWMNMDPFLLTLRDNQINEVLVHIYPVETQLAFFNSIPTDGCRMYAYGLLHSTHNVYLSDCGLASEALL